MKIVVDAFGGDNAPLEILKGCAAAVLEYGSEIIVTGDEKIIQKVAAENNISLDGIEIIHAPSVIAIEDDAVASLKSKPDSSIVVGMNLLKNGGGDAFVSAGSTAAIVAGATLLVGRIKGVKRPAIATVLPTSKTPYMLLDSGANAVCRPEMLVQFAVMGSAYMHKLFGIERPRVGLLNIGAEEEKGTELQVETYARLKNSGLNFVGNIEGRDVPSGNCDILVADGFSGNIVLKLTEGLAGSIMSMLKGMFKANFKGKLAAMLMMGGLREFKKSMDYSEYGGAPLMGIAGPVIKAHGSSDAKAIKNAIRQAAQFAEMGVIEEIKSTLEQNKGKSDDE